MGFAGFGLLMICVAVYGACRLYRVSATLPVLVVALFLLQVGAVHAAQVPGLALVEDAKQGLQAWSDRQQARTREQLAQLQATRNALAASGQPYR